jgi:hypothetical protein
MTSDSIDAYFIVEGYTEQLDDECLADKAVLVVSRTVVIEAGGPQVTTYAASPLRTYLPFRGLPVYSPRSRS